MQRENKQIDDWIDATPSTELLPLRSKRRIIVSELECLNHQRFQIEAYILITLTLVQNLFLLQVMSSTFVKFPTLESLNRGRRGSHQPEAWEDE
jgi:hypothetical protein